MSAASGYHRRMTRRIAVAALVGVVVGALSLLVPMDPTARVLAGVSAALLAYSLPLIVLFVRLDAAGTADHFDRVDPSRSESELLVVLASLAGLVAVGVMLIHGGTASEAALALLTVAAAWCAVHTTYALLYAKHYLAAEPGCITLQGSEDGPRFSDFAYLSFTLGMTYAVSDTDLRTPAVRRMVWGHTMLAYLFGTVVIATALNLVVSLAG